MLVELSCSPDKRDFSISEEAVKPATNILVKYPVIAGDYPDSLLVAVNRVLSSMTDVNYQIRNNIETDSVFSDFEVLLENDSLISFEFRKTLFRDTLNAHFYYGLILNKEDLSAYIAPEALWKNFDRSALIPVIKKAGIIDFNEYSYRKGSHTIISYALTRDSLIVYPGDEGEFRGRYRIAIPIKHLDR